ncbi:AAA family ATPase [Hyalangium versicolor]|uniref:AAA family ATPase n=1 Tax=Hyalangium versicolor TaxID=2861190 RepID=UPI001CD00070|nr:ATP-binding protein [Hyalangium versicolor]
MLRSIDLTNFKSFEAFVRVEFSPLTVLVGANASGKSNLLDAIRLVQGLGLGFSLTDTLQGRVEAGREIWPGIRGGISEVIRRGQERAEIDTDWDLQGQRVSHSLGFTVKPEPRIDGEGFAHLTGMTDSGQWTQARTFGFDETEDAWLGSSQSLFSELEHLLKQRPEFEAARLALALRQVLQRLVVLDLKPERMRGYSPQHAREMGAEGEHLSSAIWVRSRTEDARLEWVDWLSELCAPEITEIDFIETELGDVMLVLVEKDGTRTSTRALSDGTLRFLGTLTALKTAPPGSIFLIEELEQGLHPQRIHLLVEFLEMVTKERGIQVIATTHSPQVLQSLSSEGLNNAVLCARAQDGSGTLLRRFEDIPHFKEVLAKSGIDHLFTTGWLERAL